METNQELSCHPPKKLIIIWIIVTAALIITVNAIIVISVTQFHTSTSEFSMNSKKAADDPQVIVDYIASKLEIRVAILSNFVNDGKSFSSEWTLTNAGLRSLPSSKWQLYFYYPRPPLNQDFEEVIGETTALHANGWLKFHHVNGGLFKIEPQNGFDDLAAGSRLTFTFNSLGSCATRTDFCPNWYIVADGAQARVLNCTRSEDLDFVAPFDTPEKWKRDEKDSYNPYTPSERYKRNKKQIPDLETNDVKLKSRLIPAAEVCNIDLDLTLDYKPVIWKVYADEEFKTAASVLAKHTSDTILKKPASKKVIQVLFDESLSKEGSYTLDINPEQKSIVIKAGTAAGGFYGAQSLMALAASANNTLYQTHIEDSPRFPYRGLMLDVARNFFDMGEVKKLINVMSMYKMNMLHLHLTDDEGWRIDIPDIPELTKIGGTRGHDPSEKTRLMPALGSGPYPYRLGTGYYSAKVYREILQYAEDHHVTIIPEIDIPGHSNAAIKSIQAYYNRTKDSNPKGKVKDFLLYDLDDQSLSYSVQKFKNNVINPCLDSSFVFIKHVMESLKKLHQNIQPLKVFHLGGDEVAKDALGNSKACKEFQADHPDLNDIHKLKEYFVQQVIKIATDLDLKVQGWGDAFYDSSQNLFPRGTIGSQDQNGVVANVWQKPMRIREMALQDYKVIISSAQHFYLDHPYEPDPEERGLNWATRFIDMRRIFDYRPKHLISNLDFDRLGNALNKEELCEGSVEECDNVGKIDNILGMQGQLWSETTRTPSQMESMVFPRLLVLAERSWHEAVWEEDNTLNDEQRRTQSAQDYAEFLHVLVERELPKLEALDVAYYLPPPGAILSEGKLQVNSALPGLPVQYSLDNGKSWRDLTEKSDVGNKALIATRSITGQRRGRAVEVKNNI